MDLHVLDRADPVLVEERLGVPDHRHVVEAIGHQQVDASPPSQVHEVPGILGTGGEGLLAEHVGTRLESGAGEGMVGTWSGSR